MGDLDGRVAVITGAARGLGRCHALQLAEQGARIVINDLGGAADGKGRDEDPARSVCEEIKAMGGEAVPHFGDVADWNDAKSLIQTAIDEFGELNILVNNAGFLRDSTLFNMSEEDFDSVVRVHLKGHFCPMRHAAQYWREQFKAKGQIYGRLISTASESYLFCPPGQPNYSAAKAGIVTLTMGAAQLLRKYGVTANVFVPRARTRMTDSGPVAAMFAKPEEGFDAFAPENTSPLIGYLASPRAERVSGHVFVVWNREVKVVSRPGYEEIFESDAQWNTDSLHHALGPFFEKREPVTDGYTVPAM
ncbi:MAG: SDR family NAD(P)-dependent oxidoreductase [Deltaproteobacteria bacterium]|nr:SDR family NAD(P)-dependent oxidoreductase [Deltaproteobacteria bacterium]